MVVWVVGVALAPAGWAQEDEEARRITHQLQGGSSGEIEQAVTTIRQALESDPYWALDYLRKDWLKAFLPRATIPVYQEYVEDLTQRGIIADPSRTDDVEAFLLMRIKVRLQMDKTKEAVADAKSLFNVAGMRNTDKALRTLAECLKADLAEKAPPVLARLRKDQLAGAVEPAGTDGEPKTHSGVLKEIAVDPAPYVAALERFGGNDPASLLARGNLLLLADRGAEARTLFAQLPVSAESEEKVKTAEHTARALKAEDGSIGRANAFMRRALQEHGLAAKPAGG